MRQQKFTEFAQDFLVSGRGRQNPGQAQTYPSLSLSSVACNVAEKKFLIVRSFMYRFMVYSSYKADKLNIFKFKK
mgnify:CR=1 FL=1